MILCNPADAPQEVLEAYVYGLQTAFSMTLILTEPECHQAYVEAINTLFRQASADLSLPGYPVLRAVREQAIIDIAPFAA